MPGEILGSWPKSHLDEPEALLIQRRKSGAAEGASFVDQCVIEAVCKASHGLFQVAEVDEHTTLCAGALELLSMDLHLDSPAVAVDIGAFSLISGKKMSAVKSSGSFKIVHFSSKKNTPAAGRRI